MFHYFSSNASVVARAVLHVQHKPLEKLPKSLLTTSSYHFLLVLSKKKLYTVKIVDVECSTVYSSTNLDYLSACRTAISDLLGFTVVVVDHHHLLYLLIIK